jgi:hypothetical protein
MEHTREGLDGDGEEHASITGDLCKKIITHCHNWINDIWIGPDGSIDAFVSSVAAQPTDIDDDVDDGMSDDENEHEDDRKDEQKQ